ncbi:hypothetical protein [Microbacterium indicum]|uniref:hypothetical protein n=1 Tax=Microbacterium indicum TaxID=358100 RepID=UPI00040C0D82|nr:hypothetical protein [Microbacterium indicum]
MSISLKSKTAPTIPDGAPRDDWGSFDRTTSRWGAITMLAAMIVMIGGPAIVAGMLDVPPGWVIGGVALLAISFGTIWVIEPLSYFPVLGPASMYQAFMIGNISNKLLPAAIVAQSAVDARAGTRKGQLAASLAICGAATTHLAALLVFVGILGTWVVGMVPDSIVLVIQTYALPAIMGAVIVQMVVSNPNWTILATAIVMGAVAVIVLPLIVPALGAFAVAISVVLTIAAAVVITRNRKSASAEEPEAPKEHIA